MLGERLWLKICPMIIFANFAKSTTQFQKAPGAASNRANTIAVQNVTENTNPTKNENMEQRFSITHWPKMKMNIFH